MCKSNLEPHEGLNQPTRLARGEWRVRFVFSITYCSDFWGAEYGQLSFASVHQCDSPDRVLYLRVPPYTHYKVAIWLIWWMWFLNVSIPNPDQQGSTATADSYSPILPHNYCGSLRLWPTPGGSSNTYYGDELPEGRSIEVPNSESLVHGEMIRD